MLIICPSCSATYRIELSALGTSGRNVRCAHCKNVWLATAADAVIADMGGPPSIAGMGDSTAAPPNTRVSASGGADSEDDDRIPWPTDESVHPESRSAKANDPFQDSSWPMADKTPGGTDTTTTDAPSIVPSLDNEPPDQSASHDPVEDVETIAERRERRARAAQAKLKPRKSRWPLSPLVTTIIALVMILGLLLNFRYAMVRWMPQTAGLYKMIGFGVNLRGVVFENVKQTSEVHDNISVYAIEGAIVNVTNTTVQLPRLRFAIRNTNGVETYAWTAAPDRDSLAAGESLKFHARLASPPADSRDVLVRFLTKRDIVNGLPSAGIALPKAK